MTKAFRKLKMVWRSFDVNNPELTDDDNDDNLSRNSLSQRSKLSSLYFSFPSWTRPVRLDQVRSSQHEQKVWLGRLVSTFCSSFFLFFFSYCYLFYRHPAPCRLGAQRTRRLVWTTLANKFLNRGWTLSMKGNTY